MHLLGIIIGCGLLLMLLSATFRRIGVFFFTLSKYLLLAFAAKTGLRSLVYRFRKHRALPMTRPRLCRLFCEDMGPTFVKLGQIVASSGGMFPDVYVQEFQRVLDRVRPFRFDVVEDILAKELGDERGAELVDINPEPLASASIAQVHSAELKDGTSIVIKVQRPGIGKLLAADMRIMKAMAIVSRWFFSQTEIVDPVGVVEELAQTLKEELDFRKEADNLEHFNQIMREHGQLSSVKAPKPYWQWTTSRVLVMERFYGHRVDDLAAIQRLGVDAEAKLVDGMLAWFRCVLFHGFFHGDVHAGNLMILDTQEMGFLDFGIVGRFDENQRQDVTEYMAAFASADYKRLSRIISRMGGVSPDSDLDAFADALEDIYKPLLTIDFADVNYSEFLPQINRVAREHKMSMPKEFVLITKQMLYFDRYAKLLAPKLSVFSDPRLIMSLMQDMQKSKVQQNDVKALMV